MEGGEINKFSLLHCSEQFYGSLNDTLIFKDKIHMPYKLNKKVVRDWK